MCTELEAIAILDKGGVVALPTETVYGLAARIDNEAALKDIFKIKERPFFDPLIVHVHSIEQAKEYCVWNEWAEILAKNFWPGPLTLVLTKKDNVNTLITSGLDTVGLRCPKHPLTLNILKTIDVPLAAPSANKFGKTSPTTAEHVKVSLPGVPVVEGGSCDVGIESTIISIQTQPQISIELLRPGMVQWSEIQQSFKGHSVVYKISTNNKIAPGTLDDHYMPEIPLILYGLDLPPEKLLAEVNKKLKQNFKCYTTLELPRQNYLAARELYGRLREAAQSCKDFIMFQLEPYMQERDWLPLRDRLYKAATLVLGSA